MPNYDLIMMADCQVLYEDGNKIIEGHRIKLDELPQNIAVQVKSRWIEEKVDEIIFERGYVPETLEELEAMEGDI